MAAMFTQKNLGLFVQDTWAVNDQPDPDLSACATTARSSTTSRPSTRAASTAFGVRNDNTIDGSDLIQPRFGFNYTFDTERPTQVRGGVGLFQGAAAKVWLANPYHQHRPDRTPTSSTPTAPTCSQRRSERPAADRAAGGVPRHPVVDFLDPDLDQPSVWKANLAFDTELPWWGMVASTELVLTAVKDGIYYQQLNLGAPTAWARTAACSTGTPPVATRPAGTSQRPHQR